VHARIFDTVCFLSVVTFKTAVLNLACACIFSLKGSGQPSAVDSSLSLSHGACAAPEEPVGATFHLEEEEEGGIKQDFCQGENQEKAK